MTNADKDARRGRGLGVESDDWHRLYGICGYCGRDVRRKRDGRLRSHGNVPHRGATRCSGSGTLPEPRALPACTEKVPYKTVELVTSTGERVIREVSDLVTTDCSPAPYPCASCPYRRDVPSGVWDAEEYEKLPPYDRETPDQPIGAFFCHQENGRLCSGWVGCHDMNESMGLRMAVSVGLINEESYARALDYECPVALFDSGAEAAEHGMAKIGRPPPEARRTISKLIRRRERRQR